MSERIPIALIAGFLGAGKTTFLSHILSGGALNGKKCAVLVNEFGKLPIDGALLPKGDYFLSELNQGSIFCVCTKADLLKRLENIVADIAPDILLIEATGIAEPSDISAILATDALKHSYHPGAVVTMVDAVNFAKLAGALPALSAQVALADILLVNKTDLAPPETIEPLEQSLRAINPSVPIHRVVHAQYPFTFDMLANPKAHVEQYSSSTTNPALKNGPPEQMANCEIRATQPLDRKKFYDFLNSHRHHILRGKGIADFGSDKRFVEIVNGTVSSKPASAVGFHTDKGTALSLVLRDANPILFKRDFDNAMA